MQKWSMPDGLVLMADLCNLQADINFGLMSYPGSGARATFLTNTPACQEEIHRRRSQLAVLRTSQPDAQAHRLFCFGFLVIQKRCLKFLDING